MKSVNQRASNVTPTTPTTSTTLDPDQAAVLLGMTATHLSRLCRTGRIRSEPDGGVPRSEVDRILAERRIEYARIEAIREAKNRR